MGSFHSALAAPHSALEKSGLHTFARNGLPSASPTPEPSATWDQDDPARRGADERIRPLTSRQTRNLANLSQSDLQFHPVVETPFGVANR